MFEGISQALNAGLVVDVCANFGDSEAGWEVLEELIGKTLGVQEEEKKGRLVLCMHLSFFYSSSSIPSFTLFKYKH